MTDRLCRYADLAFYSGLVPIGIVLSFAALICNLVEVASTHPGEMRRG